MAQEGRRERGVGLAVESDRGFSGAHHIRFCGGCRGAAARCLCTAVLRMCLVTKCEHWARWSSFDEREVVAG
jgi:hypothetical protein